MDNVKANYKTDWYDLKLPGDYMFTEGEKTIIFICPCGCLEPEIPIEYQEPNEVRQHTKRSIPIKPSVDRPDGPEWLWNGNKECPTTTPSIRDKGCCKYHGYLTNGEFTFCSDSGQ